MRREIMCNKNSPLDMKTRSRTKKEKARATLKPARKTRTKTRKPKFLSLRLELSPENSPTSSQMTHNHKTNQHDDDHDSSQHQLNLFPLHPENLVEDKDIHDENVAFLFDTEPGTTLNSLLAEASTSSEDDTLFSPPSLTYAYGGKDRAQEGTVDVGGNYCNSTSSKLVRTAMRNKEREPSDQEKWVCYSEVLVEKKELEEVSSCTADVWPPCAMKRTKMQGLLSLKLDYQGILNAWSGKGPLFIAGESPPQTVPDLHEDRSSAHDGANVLGDGWGSVGNIWAVPEMGCSSTDIASMKVEEEEAEGKDGWKTRHREASVLRYKKKRQNRLFSKRIRYEVRKLNAEKRPRMKGRFVKRS
ncbi:hypothetical protein I3842_03G043000 [Carya illinoinensis]|uniref:CCT domain-containing protein n=1 Tax=Carya illinoinensis TaxID=32201 RepID=A0A922JXR3_CARIL|nr:hypothetical protein I3842_03G043000 [Carya illinoinensis]